MPDSASQCGCVRLCIYVCALSNCQSVCLAPPPPPPPLLASASERRATHSDSVTPRRSFLPNDKITDTCRWRRRCSSCAYPESRWRYDLLRDLIGNVTKWNGAQISSQVSAALAVVPLRPRQGQPLSPADSSDGGAVYLFAALNRARYANWPQIKPLKAKTKAAKGCPLAVVFTLVTLRIRPSPVKTNIVERLAIIGGAFLWNCRRSRCKRLVYSRPASGRCARAQVL